MPIWLRITLVILHLSLMLSIGCNGQASASKETVEIRHSFFGSYEEWLLWQTIAQEFERENPDIRVKLLYWPGNYEDKLKVVMAGGIPPDVMSAQDEPFPAYCLRNQFEDLTPLIKQAGPDFAPDKFFATSLEAFQWHGKQMAIPWNGGMLMVYYNRKLFQQSGVREPWRDWTWSDFLDACKKITKDHDDDGRIDRFGFELTGWWINAQPFIWSAGGDLLDPSMKHCILSSPEAIRALQWYEDLRFKHHVCPRAGEMTGMGDNVQFMTGRLAMLISGPWTLPFMRQTDIDWDIGHMPIGPAGRWTRGTWDGLAIAKSSRHKDAAWRFVKFAVGERGQYHVAKTGRAIPPRKSQARVFLRPDTPQHEERFLEAFELGYVRATDIEEHWNEINDAFQKEFDKLMLSSQSPKETARRIQEGINRIIQERR